MNAAILKRNFNQGTYRTSLNRELLKKELSILQRAHILAIRSLDGTRERLHEEALRVELKHNSQMRPKCRKHLNIRVK